MIKLNMNSSSTIFRLFSERVNTPAMVDKSPQPGQHLISFLFLTVGESKSPLFIALQGLNITRVALAPYGVPRALAPDVIPPLIIDNIVHVYCGFIKTELWTLVVRERACANQWHAVVWVVFVFGFCMLTAELYTENECKIRYSNSAWFYTWPQCTTSCGAVAQYSKGFQAKHCRRALFRTSLDPQEFKPLFLLQPKAVAMVQSLCCLKWHELINLFSAFFSVFAMSSYKSNYKLVFWKAHESYHSCNQNFARTLICISLLLQQCDQFERRHDARKLFTCPTVTLILTLPMT